MILSICCLQLVFYPNDVSIWKTNIFRLGTLCAIMKSVEGLIYSLILFSFGIFSIWFPQSCVDFGFDIIWTILLLVTLVSAFLV